MLVGSDYFSPSTLRLLLLVAQTGSVTEAAQVCGISQPAASKAIARAEALGAEVLMPRHRNPPDGNGGPNHWEIWLRDPDGYKVVLASPDGTANGDWQP